MPQWNCGSYSTYRQWAMDCYDAGRKEMIADITRLEEEKKELLRMLEMLVQDIEHYSAVKILPSSTAISMAKNIVTKYTTPISQNKEL